MSMTELTTVNLMKMVKVFLKKSQNFWQNVPLFVCDLETAQFQCHFSETLKSSLCFCGGKWEKKRVKLVIFFIFLGKTLTKILWRRILISKPHNSSVISQKHWSHLRVSVVANGKKESKWCFVIKIVLTSCEKKLF